jgi:hypothetical protein
MIMCVGVGVDVEVGVIVGEAVTVGVSEAVDVGAVAVEKGRRRNPSVKAIAVRVLLAFRISASPAGLPEAFHSVNSKPINIPVTPNTCK